MKRISKFNHLLLIGVIAFCFVNCSDKDSSTKNTTSNIDTMIDVQLEEAYELGQHQGRHHSSIRLLKQLLEQEQFGRAQDSSKAKVYHRLGAYYLNVRECESGVYFIDKAIGLRQSNEDVPKMDLAYSHYVRSLLNHYLGQHKLARESIKVAIKHAEEYQPNSERLALYYTHAATVYRYLNDIEQAEHYIQIIHNDAVKQTVSEQNAHKLIKIAGYFSGIEEYTSALQLFRLAAEMFDELKDTFNVLETELGISWVYLRMGEYEETLSLLKQTLKEIDQQKEEPRIWDTKRRCLNNMAYSEISLGHFTEAENYYRQILTHVQERNAHHGVSLAEAYEGLGDVALGKSNNKLAFNHYHRAIQALCIGYEDENSLSIPSITLNEVLSLDDLQRILRFKLQALEAAYGQEQEIGLLETIYDHYSTLDTVVFHIRQSVESPKAKYRLVESTLASYEKTIQTALQLYDLKKDEKYLLEAYDFATKNKAIILLDGLQDETAKYKNIPAKLLKEEQQLKREFFRFRTEIYDLSKTGNRQAVKAAKNRRFKTLRNYQKLIDQFEKEYPNYFQLKYAYQEAIRPQDLAQQLPPKSAIVEYFIGQENIYIFSISKDSELDYVVQPKPKNFESYCLSFMNQLERGQADSIQSFAQKAHGLYQLLLEKPLQNLRAKGAIERLVIVPDGPLLQFSFDALFSQNRDNATSWASANLPYLIKDYALSYAYSNRLIFDVEKSNRLTRKSNAYRGFGLEYRDSITLAGIQGFTGTKVDSSITRGMGILPYSDDEVKEIANIIGGKAFVNQKATKQTFFKEAPNSSILHLAMHGFIVRDEPLNSGLIFNRSETQKPSDYILNAADIYGLKLKTDLVVLSACHTGAGTIQKGEGVRTLARAFNYAGCPSIVASLWSATDYSTKDIMVDYFKQLKQDLPKDVALQKAKLKYFQNASESFIHPNYWTHLISIGDNRPLPLH